MSVTVYAWSQLSKDQQAAARAHQVQHGVGVKGEPPSGPESVLWGVDEAGAWSWRSALWPHDLERGDVVLGRAQVYVHGPSRTVAKAQKGGR